MLLTLWKGLNAGVATWGSAGGARQEEPSAWETPRAEAHRPWNREGASAESCRERGAGFHQAEKAAFQAQVVNAAMA